VTALRLPLPVVAAAGVTSISVLGAAALVVAGPVAGLAFLALVAAALLLRRPGVVLGLLLVAIVLFEDDPLGFLPQREQFYFGPPGPVDLLIGGLALAVAFDLALRGAPLRFPDPLTAPLVLLALATVAGAVTGYFSGAEADDIVQQVRVLMYLIVLPLLVVNVLTTRAAVRNVVLGAAVLAAFKGFEGCLAAAGGGGRELAGRTITFYQPTANFLLLLFLLAVAGALLARARLPWWIYAVTPFVLAAFTLSFRRNWWIAAVLALVLTLLLTSGVRGRRLLLPGALALGVAAWIAISASGGVQLQGAVVERARSLAPQRIVRDKTDRYRLDEMRNVREELSRHPITGLGIGIAWTARHPMASEFEGGRYYTHVVALWYWLKLGLLGLLAYLAVMVAAVYAALGVWRTEKDPLFRVLGLAVLTALIGLVVAETTGSFTGVEPRITVLLAALFGWLAAARQVRRAELAAASAAVR
jgi:O-antigen ligase